MKTPVRIALVTLLAVQVMNAAFIGPLQHAGLALATSVGACVNAALLFYQLRRQAIYQPQPGWGVFIGKLALALLGMAAVLWLVVGSEDSWLREKSLARAGHLAWIIALGAGTYFALLAALGFRLRDFAKQGVE